jgi:hypothetical protein
MYKSEMGFFDFYIIPASLRNWRGLVSMTRHYVCLKPTRMGIEGMMSFPDDVDKSLSDVPDEEEKEETTECAAQPQWRRLVEPQPPKCPGNRRSHAAGVILEETIGYAALITETFKMSTCW